jgi:pyruvate-formate lyase
MPAWMPLEEGDMAFPDVHTLYEMGEFLAAGYFELPDASPVRRWSRAVRRRFERRALTPYHGGPLYPSGALRAPEARETRIVQPSYSFTWHFDRPAWSAALDEAQGDARQTLERLGEAMEDLEARTVPWDSPHTVGGHGYTHSIPHYGRVLREGLDAYAVRVDHGLEAARREGDAGRIDLYLGLRDVLIGVRAWHRRVLAYLEDWTAQDTAPARQRDALLEALRRVPWQPARTFYEAVVAYNWVFAMDDGDNPGRIDRELYPYYARDVQEGWLAPEGARALLRAFTENVCANNGYSAAIGGSLADGGPAYTPLTRLCLEAVHHRYRPSYELAVRPDMPDEMWEAALDAIATGCGQPALYNECAYLDGLRAAGLGLSDEDAVMWNGGGCTETMIHGCSNVGSLDAGLHLPLILEGTLRRVLVGAPTFETLVDAFKRDLAAAIEDVTAGVSALQRAKAALRPQPMRTLLVDDCIARGLEFHAGGARYNWSVINVAGLSNVADSLAATREVVFERHELSGSELLEHLERDFAEAEALRVRLARCPRFGNDQPAVDAIAAEVATFVFESLRRHTPWRGGHFVPSCIMFTTYAREGQRVGATPDGRHAGEPLADSIGPAAGRDRRGPTAMLRSVTRLPLGLALGTPVLNIRFSRALFDSPAGRRGIRDLIRTYFRQGGMQIQVSVVDRSVLEDAIAHPERHGDLIVRVGGFSAHFVSLSPALQRTVLERTEHVV